MVSIFVKNPNDSPNKYIRMKTIIVLSRKLLYLNTSRFFSNWFLSFPNKIRKDFSTPNSYIALIAIINVQKKETTPYSDTLSHLVRDIKIKKPINPLSAFPEKTKPISLNKRSLVIELIFLAGCISFLNKNINKQDD